MEEKDQNLYRLQLRREYPLSMKLHFTRLRIKQWYEYYEGLVYVSFSGGKDSTVLLDIVRSMYPDVPAVFCDTGLEYPEIRDFVKRIGNVVWLRPEMNFRKVLQHYGYPVVSKKMAQYIGEVQRTKSPSLRKLRLTGIKKNGDHSPMSAISKKWHYLVDADFKVSEKCCDVMKKKPLNKYSKETGRVAYVGVMASEGGNREHNYIKYGCNAYETKHPTSKPLAFWRETDIWEYLHTFNLPYSKIYDMGYSRTGCMFCAFGAHLEKGPNRFQQMEITHPKQWKYCMVNLGMKPVLDKIGVDYMVRQIDMPFMKRSQDGRT